MPLAEQIADVLEACRDDPDLFNTVVLGRAPYWSRQKELVQSIVDYRVTVCVTGNAVGKDYALGGVIPWWNVTRPGSLAIVTGPSQTLLGSVTWKEIRKAVSQMALPVPVGISKTVKASPLRLDLGDGWGALGFSTTSIERASGQHAGELLVAIEEASGLGDELWDAADGLKFHRLVAIGNPVRNKGRFVDLIKQAARDKANQVPKHLAVNCVRISSLESPHAHLERSPFGLADKTWLEDVKRRYGDNSQWYKSHVLAEVPETGDDVLIAETWLDFSASLPAPPALTSNHPLHKTRRIAIDLGEGVGRDSSVVLVRDDRQVLGLDESPHKGLAEAAETAARFARKWGVPPERISYDKLGPGRQFPKHMEARGIVGIVPYAGSGAPRSADYVNRRAEGAWALRGRLDPDAGTPFRLPGDHPCWPRLRLQLSKLTGHVQGRKSAIISKEAWSAACGGSPDLADALVQSFA